MGAQQFSTIASGKDAREAFNNAVASAQWESGHGGYTGTIAEKDDFVVLPTPPDIDKLGYASPFPTYDKDGNRIGGAPDAHWAKVNDKWGPAGCYDLGNDRYLFFGWASS